MKCPRCAAEIPPQSKFCLRCGTPVNATTEIPAAPASLPPLKNRRTPGVGKGTWAAVGGMAVLAALICAFVVKGQLAQKAGQTGTGTLVQAPGEGRRAPLVQAPGETPKAPVVQAPAEGKPSTADIEDYLAFLKQIEVTKQQLIREQTGNALQLLAQAKGLSASLEEKDYNNTFENMNKSMKFNSGAWGELSAKFQGRVPPQSCLDLANKYYDHLGKLQAQLLAINDALSKVASNPNSALSALSQMQGAASQEMDEAIRKADDALADVCDKYHLHKEFDIRGDSGSSGMFR